MARDTVHATGTMLISGEEVNPSDLNFTKDYCNRLFVHSKKHPKPAIFQNVIEPLHHSSKLSYKIHRLILAPLILAPLWNS